jgi:hypothetical protein
MSQQNYSQITKLLFAKEKRSSPKSTKQIANISNPSSHDIKFGEKPTLNK